MEILGFKLFSKLLAILISSWIVIGQGALAWGQTFRHPLTEEERLEQDFTDPLTTLPQVLIRDSLSPANYGPCTRLACPRNEETNQFIIRPLIPRIPANTLLPFTQLVRPTLALATVPSSRGGTRTELGDLPMFDLAVLPWLDRRKTGLSVGVGLSLVLPTATSKSAGQGAWQTGPALAAIYSGIPRLLVGFVAQNPISFAYTSSARQPQNTFELQPILELHLWEKWYLRSADANWTIGWHRHSPTMLPLSLGVGRTLLGPALPPISIFVTGQWMVYRQFAPIAPQTTVNFGLVIGFPGLRDYWVGANH
jgi:hypothetical protein